MGASLLLLVTACGDPAFLLQGTVHGEDGQPISGAMVHVSCGNGIAVAQTKSDDDGRFQGNAVGWRPMKCTLEASASGYRAFSEPIGPSCTKKQASESCLEVSGRVQLKPSSPGREGR